MGSIGEVSVSLTFYKMEQSFDYQLSLFSKSTVIHLSSFCQNNQNSNQLSELCWNFYLTFRKLDFSAIFGFNHGFFILFKIRNFAKKLELTKQK
jgi:hypothetical protein